MMKKSLLYNLFIPDRIINKYFLTQSTDTATHGYEGNSKSKNNCRDMLLERHERAIEDVNYPWVVCKTPDGYTRHTSKGGFGSRPSQ